jgi:RNA polymerase sigma-70 factor, ECF subfamily
VRAVTIPEVDRDSVRPMAGGDGYRLEGPIPDEVDPGDAPPDVDGYPSEEPLDVASLFDAAVREHLDTLRANAKKRCRSHYDPEDLVQETLQRAYSKRDQLHDLTRIRPWLLTILKNTFRDILRKQRRQPPLTELDDEIPAPPPEEPRPWQSIEQDEHRKAIARLPEDVRDTYRMYVLEDRDYAAISKALNIPTATVGSRIHRARARLKILLLHTRGGRVG